MKQYHSKLLVFGSLATLIASARVAGQSCAIVDPGFTGTTNGILIINTIPAGEATQTAVDFDPDRDRWDAVYLRAGGCNPGVHCSEIYHVAWRFTNNTIVKIAGDRHAAQSAQGLPLSMSLADGGYVFEYAGTSPTVYGYGWVKTPFFTTNELQLTRNAGPLGCDPSNPLMGQPSVTELYNTTYGVEGQHLLYYVSVVNTNTAYRVIRGRRMAEDTLTPSNFCHTPPWPAANNILYLPSAGTNTAMPDWQSPNRTFGAATTNAINHLQGIAYGTPGFFAFAYRQGYLDRTLQLLSNLESLPSANPPASSLLTISTNVESHALIGNRGGFIRVAYVEPQNSERVIRVWRSDGATDTICSGQSIHWPTIVTATWTSADYYVAWKQLINGVWHIMVKSPGTGAPVSFACDTPGVLGVDKPMLRRASGGAIYLFYTVSGQINGDRVYAKRVN